MKNIKNTAKYIKTIKIVLIIMLFSIVLPLIARADEEDLGYDTVTYPDYGYDTVTYPDYGYDTVTYPDYGYDTVTYPDYGYDTVTYPDYGYDKVTYPDYGYDTVTTIGYGYGYGYGYNYPRSYYPTGRSNWVGVGVALNPGWTIPTPPSLPTPPGNIVTPVYQPIANPVYIPTYQPQTVSVYYPQSTTYPNQVLSYQDTNPSLDSVYLSDIPYTGLSDYYGLIVFISILLSWSATLAYMFLRRKISEKMLFANVYSNTDRKNDMNDSINSGFVNQIVSDKSDIREVEEYAKMKKVLLSTDATSKLVRLQRLGEGNAKSIIDNLSTNEWIAVGEKNLIL